MSEENKEAEYWELVKDEFGFTNMNFSLISRKQLWNEEDRLC